MISITDSLFNLLTGNNIALISVTLAAAYAGYGSAKSVGAVGAVSQGIIAEDPKKYGRLLILEALPGTQGIYGLISWFMYLYLSGYISGSPMNLTLAQGLMVTAAVIPMGIVGYHSALHQAKVACAGCALVAKRPEQMSKALIMAGMVETYAIFALLINILTLIYVL